jgi:hypothetical protein
VDVQWRSVGRARKGLLVPNVDEATRQRAEGAHRYEFEEDIG